MVANVMLGTLTDTTTRGKVVSLDSESEVVISSASQSLSIFKLNTRRTIN
jgi:hypothetical protein